MFILQILSGLIIGFYISTNLCPLLFYFLPKTINYTLKGEMKSHSVLLWFIKPTKQILLFYILIIIYLFFPSIYRNEFVISYYFLVSFLIVTLYYIFMSFKDENLQAINKLWFEDSAIKYNFYKNHYTTMKSYCDSGNLKKDRFEDFEGAIKDYTKAIEINQNYSSLYYNRGTALLNISDFEKAIKDFDKAIELESHISEYYDGRATAKRDSGNKKGAIEDFTESIKLNPENSSTIINLHQLLKD